MTLEQLLLERDVASMLDVSISTLARWRETRFVELPYVKVGNKIRYSLAAVEAFLEHENADSEDDYEVDFEDDLPFTFGKHDEWR